jgi:hypothetical protein
LTRAILLLLLAGLLTTTLLTATGLARLIALLLLARLLIRILVGILVLRHNFNSSNIFWLAVRRLPSNLSGHINNAATIRSFRLGEAGTSAAEQVPRAVKNQSQKPTEWRCDLAYNRELGVAARAVAC